MFIVMFNILSDCVWYDKVNKSKYKVRHYFIVNSLFCTFYLYTFLITIIFTLTAQRLVKTRKLSKADKPAR